MRTRWIAAISSTVVLILALASVAAAQPSGQLFAWGYNGYGEVGNGNVETQKTPQLITGLSTLVAAAGGYYHSLGLLSNGTVEAWGYNYYGELGDGTNTQRKSPVPVPGLQNVVAIAAGEYSSYALLSNGTVEAWGYNGSGELGDGTNEERKSPQLIPGLQNVVAISAGTNFALALLSNGTVEGWGYNHYGELGDGSTEERKSPEVISGLSGVVQVSADGYASLELLANGTVKASGYNDYGELGDGTETQRNSPVTVHGLVGVSSVSGGQEYSEALLSDGTVDTWGGNNYSALGNGTTATPPTLLPTAVPGLSGVRAIFGSSYFTLVLLQSGTLKAWGWNGDGEVGNGTELTQDTPIPVAGLTGVLTAGRGAYSYTALAVEGALAALSPSTLAFPTETVGTASPTQNLVVTNTGPAAMTISGDVLTGSGAAGFQETVNTCHGATLVAGGTCSITLLFKPTTGGAANASLAISSTAANTLPVVSLSGTGVAPPAETSNVKALPPVPPFLSALSLSSHSFRAAHSGASAVSAKAAAGTVVSYTDSQAAATTFTVQQALRGVKSSSKSKTCGKAPAHPAKHAKPCTYYKTLGSFTHFDATGPNKFRFTGRVESHTLKSGSYRLVAVASAVGGKSPSKSASFQIKH